MPRLVGESQEMSRPAASSGRGSRAPSFSRLRSRNLLEAMPDGREALERNRRLPANGDEAVNICAAIFPRTCRAIIAGGLTKGASKVHETGRCLVHRFASRER